MPKGDILQTIEIIFIYIFCVINATFHIIEIKYSKTPQYVPLLEQSLLQHI